MTEQNPIVSIVLPCLNEEEAIGPCIELIQKVFTDHKINGEIVVSDNASTDQSAAIAQRLGAVVVHQPIRGYGHAYFKGFASARGEYLIMADCDGTYDFNEIPNFLKKLIYENYDFVSGSRYVKGYKNEGIPFLHRYVGNPLLTTILNFLFGLNYTDVYTGFRGFTKGAYSQIKPISSGMEFNLELAINAKLAGLKVAEIPIALHERKGVSKLRTFRDGWRSLRMMLLYSPNKVFIKFGILLLAIGLLAHVVALSGLFKVGIGGKPLSGVTGIFAFILSVVGFEIFCLGLHLRTYSWSNRFEEHNKSLNLIYKSFKMEIGLLWGALSILAGITILIILIVKWIHSQMLPLPNPEWASFGGTLVVIGFNIIFSSLFIAAMAMSREIHGK